MLFPHYMLQYVAVQLCLFSALIPNYQAGMLKHRRELISLRESSPATLQRDKRQNLSASIRSFENVAHSFKHKSCLLFVPQINILSSVILSKPVSARDKCKLTLKIALYTPVYTDHTNCQLTTALTNAGLLSADTTRLNSTVCYDNSVKGNKI